MPTSVIFRFLAWLVAPLAWVVAPVQDAVRGPEQFSMRVVASGLQNPWQMRWGPDGRFWVTERTGKRVVRVNAGDGSRTVAVTIADALQRHAQDGVLGLALHPGLLENRDADFVYVVVTHDVDPGATEVRRLAIRRYVYDARTETLGNPTDILDNLPAGDDHISGRLVFGLDQKLYLTIGDQGYNQLALYCSPIHSQELPTAEDVRTRNFQRYEGKVLRIGLDGSIPTDNPMLEGVRSHVYSYGHRNAQGLIQAPDGKLYASEHGPSMDDELNLIQAGKHYGWPYVAGYRDDRVYVYANWSLSAPTACASLTFNDIVAPASVPQQKESAWSAPNFMPPLRTFFTVGPEYRFGEQGNATIAPSGIDVYTTTTGGIPGWATSVLVTGLTRGTVYRVKLNEAGDAASGPTLEYFKAGDRYRDVLIAPDGRTIYVATDASSKEHPGAILAFTYQSGVGAEQDGDWPAYGRDPGGERFSPLDAIRRENVASLQVAWTFRTGDAYEPKNGRPTAFEATPLHVDGTLYLSTPVGRVIALDPVDGRQRWAFDAASPRDKGYGDFASRGVSMWQRGSDRRIFIATIDARLIALDASTGTPIRSFGDQGVVDLRQGLRVSPRGFADYQVTSPPAVIGNTIVVGSAIADGTSMPHPSGEVRGFDAITGRLRWSWDPVPQDPAAIGADSWKNNSAARAGGANAWSVIAADPARNLVFVPTSSPNHDYFGGARIGDNLFADSVVALRADTGARVWHFQTVHHDLWDYDVASPPILFDWRKDGRTVAAVGVASKTGHLFILDRETGTPLIPVEERAVPKSDVAGEVAAPTQPFPTAPRALAPTALSPNDAWGATDEDRAWCRETIGALRTDGFFTPPSLKGTLVVPGNVGGMAWGGIAHDRVNALLIMPVNNLAAEVRLIPRDAVDTERQAGRLSGDFEYHPQLGTSYGVVRRFLLGPKTRLPCTPPPWGTLAAVKAATGEIAWQVPLGQFPGTEKIPRLQGSGSIALGGPIATAGGLVFTAGTLEAAIYAFDARTGERLWKGSLPTSARSTPMTYLGRDGRQYVVISAGGHAAPIGPPLGDYLVAFALPRVSPKAIP